MKFIFGECEEQFPQISYTSDDGALVNDTGAVETVLPVRKRIYTSLFLRHGEPSFRIAC